MMLALKRKQSSCHIWLYSSSKHQCILNVPEFVPKLSQANSEQILKQIIENKRKVRASSKYVTHSFNLSSLKLRNQKYFLSILYWNNVRITSPESRNHYTNIDEARSSNMSHTQSSFQRWDLAQFKSVLEFSSHRTDHMLRTYLNSRDSITWRKSKIENIKHVIAYLVLNACRNTQT